MFYINKYIADGYVQSETFSDEVDARIAAKRNDLRFNMPYALTMVFETVRNGVNKFVKEVTY